MEASYITFFTSSFNKSASCAGTCRVGTSVDFRSSPKGIVIWYINRASMIDKGDSSEAGMYSAFSPRAIIEVAWGRRVMI